MVYDLLSLCGKGSFVSVEEWAGTAHVTRLLLSFYEADISFMINVNYPIKGRVKDVNIIRARKPHSSKILIQIRKSDFIHVSIFEPPIYKYIVFRFDI